MLMKHAYVVFWTFFLFVSLRDSVGIAAQIFSKDPFEDECDKPPYKVTTCAENSNKEVWYYNKSAGGCILFNGGGCDRNVNNFPDKVTCEQACDPPFYTLEQAEENS
uniref:Putative kunitz/bovine pancreatic trypsin inhibitor domain protein n=1 Tax=Amblyomma americanum TaxID=6943 RepID=A0A0C9SCZ8_AMBAM